MYRFLLVGDPVEHSRSPAIHRRAFEVAGLEGEYVARRVGRGRLGHVIEELRRGDVDGLNVTMPLKGEAFESCESLTVEAARSGSVNTVGRRGGAIEGHSTDTVAFRAIFESVPAGSTLLVLGAGGAARAALAAWNGEARVSARDPRQAGTLGEVAPWGKGVDGSVLVNATPVGMRGEALPREVVEGAAMIIDLPYGSAPTPLALWARARSTPLVDGLEFLALQAAASFEWWTGAAVDSSLLVEAARNV